MDDLLEQWLLWDVQLENLDLEIAKRCEQSPAAQLIGTITGRAGEATQRLGAITKEGSPIVRYILGQLVLHVLKRDPTMRQWHRRIKLRRGSKIARVAVMRRLTVIIWHMLKRNEPYVVGGSCRGRETPASTS